MKESWRAVVDRPGYFVSDQGRVISHAGIRPRILKCSLGENGYLSVGWRKLPRKYVHIMVLEAFVGPRPVGFDARHKNGLRRDCRLKKLAWCSRSVNMMDKLKHDTHNRGERHWKSKLTPAQVKHLRCLRTKGARLEDLAEKFGVCRMTVYNIARKNTWK